MLKEKQQNWLSLNMSDSVLKVEVVTPEKRVWSGEAKMISARTLEGDLGVLPGHAPLLGVLADGTVSVKAIDGSTNDFVINGGFISVSNNRVSILGESANYTLVTSAPSD